MFFISIQLEIQTRLRAKNRIIEFCIFLVLFFSSPQLYISVDSFKREILVPTGFVIFSGSINSEEIYCMFSFLYSNKNFTSSLARILTAAASFKNSYRTLKASRLG